MRLATVSHPNRSLIYRLHLITIDCGSSAIHQGKIRERHVVMERNIIGMPSLKYSPHLESEFVNKLGDTNAPTAKLIRSVREVAATLKSSSTSLLSAAVRLAEVGQDQEALLLIELERGIQEAEDKVRRHAKEAGTGMIVKLSTH